VVTLALAHALLRPGAASGVALVAIASVLLLWITRRTLRVGLTFPELNRVPLLQRLLGS
jgi:hypothetical protein